MSKSIALLALGVWLAACADAPPTGPGRPDAAALAKAPEQTRELEIKFREGLGVRSRPDGRLASVRGRSVSALQTTLDHAGIREVRPLFALMPEERLAGLERAARERSGRPAPDLRSWHRVSLAPGADMDAVLATLRALPEVEHANPAPRPARPPTPDYSAAQTYFSPAPSGTDAAYARTLPGGRGTGVMLVDLEYNWNFNHEDLGIGYWMLISGNLAPDPLIFDCTAPSPYAPYYTEHGTAVVGELYARDNGFGVTGGVPDATLRLATPMFWIFYYPALGILNAAGQMRPGDVLLLEMHHQDPYGQYGPIENEPSVYDAIKAATQAGIIVVEPAGNGKMSLDPPNFGGRFDRNVKDSGAIIVGGGNALLAYSSISESNFGERVDVQGRGEGVMTTGYGCGSRETAYRTNFAGTSSASPIVAAAAVSIQGYLKATGRPALTPAQMRTLLVTTGTPQTGTRKIGPYPNLRAAVAHLDQP